ncbi:MAG: MHS family MFS transporter [Pseudomonadota bacterium]|nr:MHS family MFS transporter [Pseudomonadota bacterium]
MVTTAVPVKAAISRPMTREERKVIFASSLGTIFEWYDFYLYGSLAGIIAKQFFSALDPTAAFIASLLAFAAGFLVRPFGALVFGRLGDMVGRKYTFLITIMIMGISTVAVGALPTYSQIGIAAPIILVALRLLQGLALGGEYGGAATYVAEHAPHGKRGAYTSWIQTTATLGLFLSLIVIIVTKSLLGDEIFNNGWGWRVPFLISLLLLVVSIWIRLSLNETPAFKRMKEEGKTSKAPLTEALATWSNGKIVLLALLGLTAGQGVVWYTGQFYALFFLTAQLKVDATTAQLMIGASLLLGTPFFIIFGTLSDRIGRKPIIMLGCLLAALTFIPLFHALTDAANPELSAAQAKNKVVVRADPAECSFQGSPIARDIDFKSSCDIAKRFLAQSSVSYDNVDAPAGTPATITFGDKSITAPSAVVVNQKFDADSSAKISAFKKAAGVDLAAAGYPAKAKAIDFMSGQWWKVVGILWILVLFVTMVYAPIAAMLVELFPTRIRYTSMSVPYHFGNGWFGGLLPTTAFAIVASTGNMYNGLWYPIVVAAMSFVIGTLFIKETKDVDIYRGD